MTEELPKELAIALLATIFLETDCDGEPPSEESIALFLDELVQPILQRIE